MYGERLLVAESPDAGIIIMAEPDEDEDEDVAKTRAVAAGE